MHVKHNVYIYIYIYILCYGLDMICRCGRVIMVMVSQDGGFRRFFGYGSDIMLSLESVFVMACTVQPPCPFFPHEGTTFAVG